MEKSVLMDFSIQKDFHKCKPTYINQLHKIITKCSLKKCISKIFFISAFITAVKPVLIKT